MPKISHPLSESERILFHANYKYMWDKISTTYFAVLRSKTPPSAKIDEKKLPTLSVPSATMMRVMLPAELLSPRL